MGDSIVVSQMCKRYGTKQIFDCFNMRVQEGEFLCITGKSGCGKTTLLNILGLLEQPEAGNVEICGILNPKGRDRLKLLRNDISYYFQNNGLIEDETVRYNLLIAQHFKKMSSYEKRREQEEMLEEFGISDVLNKKIYELSGGEQQRVAMVQCFIKPSKIILADEPTSSLDLETQKLIMKQFEKYYDKGKTIILVTHNAEIQTYASRIIKLD